MGSNLNEAAMYSVLGSSGHVAKTHGFSIVNPSSSGSVCGKRKVRAEPVLLDMEMDRGAMTLEEYVRGTPQERVGRDLWWIFGSLLEAVFALHSSGITHNDIKPGNIILDPDTLRVRLIDMGSARHVKHGGQVMCTYPFCAPESLKRGTPTTFASDAYSVGAVSLFCMTGGGYLYDFTKHRYGVAPPCDAFL